MLCGLFSMGPVKAMQINFSIVGKNIKNALLNHLRKMGVLEVLIWSAAAIFLMTTRSFQELVFRIINILFFLYVLGITKYLGNPQRSKLQKYFYGSFMVLVAVFIIVCFILFASHIGR
jgi:hypothetical protein